jgi:hypothetical protein
VHQLAPGQGHGTRRPHGHSLPLPDKHELSAHLHDRDHVRHLCAATVILIMNVAITLGVPILGIQILVVIGLFGREAVTILLT